MIKTEPNNSEQPLSQQRRRFLVGISLALASLASLLVEVPMLGFMFGPLLRKTPPVWRGVGPAAQFKIGETVAVSFANAAPLAWDGTAGRTAAWLRRESADGFIAFAINCTHLGCPVQWKPDANLFLCPCHGGVYYSNGAVAGGPPPKPLPRYRVRVTA
ncbi:MAG: Rieske (2Fe-2S) protein, partial [Kiritimatiellaeota bacterium]|nr:Rieske (2Fe-2S) protein [Kiritimatiellota bacterium]